jgi:hypothetical protein
MENNKEDLIPILQVLDNMYSDSYISLAARDYYYLHYASESKKRSMDIEDKIIKIIGILIISLIPISIILYCLN